MSVSTRPRRYTHGVDRFFEMLSLLNQPKSKWHLQCGLKTTGVILGRYLALAEQHGLVTTINGRYVLTQKGHEVLGSWTN